MKCQGNDNQMLIIFDNQMSIIQSDSKSPIKRCLHVQMWEQLR